MKEDFLLEIGCENIPSTYLDDLVSQLRALVEESLRMDRLECESISVFGTPKRLVVHLKGLWAKQKSAEERIIGPPVKVAFEPDGSFTRAAEGFAKSQGVSLKELCRVETDRGEYVAVVKRARALSSVSILRSRAAYWVSSLRSPKTMKWNASGACFARPIRWILCLYGNKVVRVTAAGLTAGRATRLSPLFDEYAKIGSPRDYFALMKKNRILLDPKARRDAVRSSALKLARSAGGALVKDEELIGEVANLLESPVGFSGHFDETFLSLPREVIVTALKSHQRYFAVEDKKGRLLPRFVAFADGVRRNSTGILRGYERVLRARLDDAVFYFKEDTAQPLSKMAEKLSAIVWLEGFGTLAEKARRMESLALWLSSACGITGSAIEEKISRASLLAKADLASEMVKDGKEFTSLQGYIGREYARACGEDPEIAEAIFEHYLPRFASDMLPQSATGLLLALADRIDTVSGCFLAGLGPTGSQDPYGLRRQAMGVVRIALEKQVSFSLPEAIDFSLKLFEKEGHNEPRREIRTSILDLYTQRLYSTLRSQEIDHDLVAAVLGAPWEYPTAAASMAEKLKKMRNNGKLVPFALAMKRIGNIIPKALKSGFDRKRGEIALESFAKRSYKELGFDPALFSEDAETVLCEEVSRACTELAKMCRSGKSQDSIEVLEEIVPAINRYFDYVLVNCDEERLRKNRISFLLNTYNAFSMFLDFSAIAGE